ncbi:MAG: GxxExxY protein [Candidatus Yonathbacteria bacterium]|nr:GxxExxY protein [Candidatus Yonathbacteria bacterium]NTW48075.1 GxxExxY protein [Candidatus Yonathbacteria bacterium]
MKNLIKKEILYPELSYIIMGCLFNVHNEIGSGHKERIYERAVAEAFIERGLSFKEQVYVPVIFHDKYVGKYFLDFLVDGKIVVELKAGDQFLKKDTDQILRYLQIHNISLGILARFTSRGVIAKRIIHIK